MLARRFTIVCLIVAIFGMFLATVVADNGHARKHMNTPYGVGLFQPHLH
jgi:hypothetical protein